jgi:hypothetical protein
MLRGLERGASKAKGFKMNANACEVAKAEGEMGRGESDVFGIKAGGRRQPMMGPDRGVPSQLRSRADDQALLIATLLANRFHSNPIPQLFFHLVINILRSNSTMLTPP